MIDKLKPAPLAYENHSFLSSPDGRILRILAEYQEPLSRFRREQIQDTVVFFGSARFEGADAAQKNLAALKTTVKASPAEQEKELKRAQAAVEMARYYEDARRLAHLLTEWSIQIPARRRRFVVTTGGGTRILAPHHEIPGLRRPRHRLARRSQPLQVRRYPRRRLHLPPRRPYRTPPG